MPFIVSKFRFLNVIDSRETKLYKSLKFSIPSVSVIVKLFILFNSSAVNVLLSSPFTNFAKLLPAGKTSLVGLSLSNQLLLIHFLFHLSNNILLNL